MTAFQPIIFNLGDELYGINIINVRAIEQTQTIVRVPNSSSNIKGIINLRGEVIPVIDLKAKFGLVCYLTKWSSPEVAESGAMSGALLENFTVSEIVKGYQNAGLEPYLYFYRDRDAKEIDVILEGDGKLCPLEIKKTATPDKRIVRAFGVIDKSPLQLGTGAVLCMAEQLGAFDRENLIVPIWAI